jgi:hypothetical protein
VDERSVHPTPTKTLGVPQRAIVVEDVDATIAVPNVRKAEVVGDVQTYEDVDNVCDLRGPGGVNVELAEELG